MKYEPDPAMAAWLVLNARGFQWDSGNSEKNAARHGVYREEVEAIFSRSFLLAGRIVYDGPECRWMVLGLSAQNRKLALVFTVRADLIRPISCRPMSKQERARYEKEKRSQKAS